MQSTEQYSVTVGIEDLINNVIKLLYDYLLGREPKINLQRFDELKTGEIQSVASTPRDDNKHIEVLLSLNQIEFVGILNFEAFQQFTSHLLDLLRNTQTSNQTLPIREEAAGQRFLVSIPAALEIQQQLNVLMLGFDLKEENQIHIELLFFEPSQFKEAIKNSNRAIDQ
jgi:hypothetical protein